MRYTLTILGAHHTQLLDVLWAKPDVEGAAYLRCGRSVTEEEARLLVREVIPVRDEHYLIREIDRLSLDSRSYAAAAKQAAAAGDSLVFVHSHPTGYRGFSPQDDREDPKLMRFFGNRLPQGPHGSLVFDSRESSVGRICTPNAWLPIDRIRVIGDRFRFLDDARNEEPLPPFFDRQVRAFGPDVQRLLRRLHVGVIGVGGTGSAVVEQLTRLGVGTLSLFDAETLDPTNVNRVYGSGTADASDPKTAIAEAHIARIALGTEVRRYSSIAEEATARHLRACDLVFGCTDRHAPRGILVQLSLRYLIPVIDVGVQVKSAEQTIRGIYGRVTTLLPGEACLFCRERISPRIIALEALSPEEWQALADEDYAPELEEAAPAVIMFTTAVAAQGVTELLHRLTGFMGSERQSSEVLLFLHETMLRANRTPPKPDCVCSQTRNWGRGDSRSFLGLTWPDARA